MEYIIINIPMVYLRAKGWNMQDNMAKIISDKDGKKIVLINDIKFKTRRTIDWKMVESYLKEYIGNRYEILETSEKVYVGSDFPDEFCHANDKMKLKGANAKRKLIW